MAATATGRAQARPTPPTDAELDRRALAIMDSPVNVICRGDRALLGIIDAGEVRDHAWLTVDQLYALAEEARSIARKIRPHHEPSRPAPCERCAARAAERQRQLVQALKDAVKYECIADRLDDPIELAKARNRAQVERLRERLANRMAA